MSFVASRLNLRLFIDGLEVPVIGARCTFAEGAPASAEIQVVATDQVYELLPRSLVTLYCYENYDYDTSGGGATLKRYGPDDLRRWKLLYMGEMVGINFTKQSGQRQAILVCLDHTNYWDFIKQHFVNFRNGGVELFEQAFLGINASQSQFYDITTKDVATQLFVWLNKSKVADENGEKHANIFLGVQRVLREMFFNSNSFYAREFNRLRIGDCIVGLPQDQTAAKLYKLVWFEQFIKGQMGGAGGMVTLRQIIELLLGTAFHTYVTVPCPMFDPTGAMRGFDASSDPDLAGQVIPRTAHANAALNYTVIKPDAWFLSPPRCNLIFPHMYTSMAYQRNHLSEPTRLFLRTSLLFTGSDKWLTERLYAPDFDVFNVLLQKEGGYLRRMAETLLPHERHVGLNPSFTWQSDLGAYVQEGPRREYLSRLADYLFWKQRFANRTINTSGPLNTNLVPGYPGVVFDRVGHSDPRHFVGHLQSVVHAIDQTGGWTYATFTGARVHNETIDFDNKGRSLEEITSRGADGFLDDRYDLENIGTDVYTPMFGTTAITDELTLSSTGDAVAIGSVKEAVEFIDASYAGSVYGGSDINAFTQALTQRPKANLVDLMGIPTNSDGSVPASFQTVADETLEIHGFLCTAVDVDSPDIQPENTTFESTQIQTIVTTETTETTKQGKGVGVATDDGETAIEPGETETEVAIVTVTKNIEVGVTATYELKEILEEKQEKTQAYIDSLVYRGMRG